MGAQLAVEDEAAVRDAIAALEVAEGVVPAAAFPALQDPALRSAVTQRLGACGRVLISAGPGWVSGYDDEVADTLAGLNVGVLSPTDRAVLALVLLRTVAIHPCTWRVERERVGHAGRGPAYHRGGAEPQPAPHQEADN